MASVLDRIAAARDKAKGTKQEEPYYGSNVLDRIAAARDEAIISTEKAIISTEKDRMMEERARENFAPSDKTVEALYGSDRQQPSGRYSSPFADRAWFMMGEDAWKAPIEKYAADKEVERLEGELSHAEEMYGTYSDLYGSWQTSPEEKAQALEWKNRFGAQIEDINGGALVDAKTKQAEATANYYATMSRRPGFNAGVAAGEAIDNGFKTSEIEGAVTNWEFFTDAEKDIYNYLLGTGGEEAAEAYWKYMQEPAQQRLGNIYTDRVQSIDPGFGRFLAERAYGIGAGVENALGGFMQATTEEELPTSGTQFGYYQMGEGKTGLDKITYELGYQAGNMLPSMLLSGGLGAAGAPAKLAQLAGSGAMGFSAGGNAYKQGLDMGMTTEQAKAYGRLIGASEGGLQYVLGGISALGGTSGKFAEAVKGIENGFLRFIAQTGGSMVSEATEEGLQAILDPIFRNAASGAEINIDWSEVAYNALMGGLMGGVFEAPGNAAEAIAAGRGDAMYTPNSFKGENFAFEGLIPANVSQPGESGNSAEIRPDSPGLAQAREQQTKGGNYGYGEYGNAAFEQVMTDFALDADSARAVFQTAYEAGRLDTDRTTIELVNPIQERAFEAGKKDYVMSRPAIENGAKADYTETNTISGKGAVYGTEAVHLREGGQRLGGQNTRGQVRSVEENAGRNQSGQAQNRIADSETASLTYGRKVSTASLGIGGGSRIANIRVVTGGDTTATRAARQLAKARGLRVIFFEGNNLEIHRDSGEKVSARAYITGDRVFIRVDHAEYTADQLMRHETGHDMIAKGEVDINEVRRRIDRTFGKEKAGQLADMYAEAYEGTGMSAEEIWEEVVCDSLGDMNIFSETANEANAWELLQQTKAASIEAQIEGVRGPPTEGKASRETSRRAERGRSIELETMENNRFQRLRQFHGDLPAEWYAYTKDYFYVYSNQSYMDYTILVKAKINEANRMDINNFMEELENGTFNGAETFNNWTATFRRGKGRDSWHRISSTRTKTAGRNDGVDVRARGSKHSGNSEAGGNAGKIKAKYSRELGRENIEAMESRLNSMNAEYRRMETQDFQYKEAPEYKAFMDAISDARQSKKSLLDRPAELDKALDEYRTWQDESGYSDLIARMEEMRGDMKTLRGKLDRAREQAAQEAKISTRAQYNEEFAKKYASKAARKFGTTGRFDLAGYLTVNGSLLDFSQRQGYRVRDHREIAEVLDFLPEDHGYSDGLIEFMNLGNIRMQSYGIDIAKAPNAAQKSMLRKFFNSLNGEVTVDFSNENGDSVGSVDYNDGTRADKILNDIDNYFKTGKIPQQSITAQFHYSRDLETIKEMREDNAQMRLANEELEKLFRSGAIAKLDKKTLSTFAKDIVKGAGSSMNVSEVTEKLRDLHNYLIAGEDGSRGKWDSAYGQSYEIAAEILENATTTDESMYQQYRELRDTIRNTGISISREYNGDMEGYESINDFRKANYGRIKLVKDGRPVDSFYEELAESYPEFFDSTEHTNPADQLNHIAEVLDSLRPFEVNPFSYNMKEASAWLANDIMMRFYRVQNEKLADTIQKGKDKALRARRREIAKRDEKIKKLKEKQRAKEKKMSESRQASILRSKIQRHIAPMKQKLLRPSDKQHVPQELREAVASMLDAINLESSFDYKPGTQHQTSRGATVGIRAEKGSGDPTKRTEEFRNVREIYQKIIAEGNADEMVIDPALIGGEGNRSMLDEVITMRDIPLASMNVAQLQTVWDCVRAIEHSITEAGKTFAKSKFETTKAFADAFVADTATRRAIDRDKASDKRAKDLETPYTFFSRYGNAGMEFYRALRNAQDTEQVMQDELVQRVANVVSSEQKKKLEKESKEFTTVNGDKLTLSKAHVMEIYLLNKRDQARGHLTAGGIVQPEAGKVKRGAEPTLLTEVDVANIIGSLTEKEQKIADGLQQLTLWLAEKGNEASMKVYGYEKFGDPNYWTIRSANEQIAQTVEKNRDNPRSIANMGSAKPLTPNATNALDISGVFETFSKHSSDMLTYSAWLATMEDANRLFNYKFKDKEGKITGKNMQTLLNKVGGASSTNYWLELMKDIQNGIQNPADTGIEGAAKKLVANTKKASVSANIRVVIQQPTAIARTAAVLNPVHLAAALGKDVAVKPAVDGWKKAVKYAPIAARKAAGGYEVSSNPKQLADLLYRPITKKGKAAEGVKEAPLWLAGEADKLTWGTIWNACEMQIFAKNKALEGGALYEKVAELFTEVIDQTQVVDGVLQRSQAMRSGSALMQQMTSFTGEPTMAANMVIRAYDNVRREQDVEKRRTGRKVLARTVGAYVLTAGLNAFAQSIIDAMRDDEEDEKFWKKVNKHLWGITGKEEKRWDRIRNVLLAGNAVNNLNPLTWIPILKDVVSIVQGYSVERMDAASISDFLSDASLAVKSLGGEGKYTTGYAFTKLMASGGKILGIPAANLIRDVESVIDTIHFASDDVEGMYEVERLISTIPNNKSRYVELAYMAYIRGDMELHERIRQDMIAAGVNENDIKTAMENRMKKAYGVDEVKLLPQRYMTPEQQKSYDAVMDKVEKSDIWKNADARVRKNVSYDYYEVATGASSAQSMVDKMEMAAKYGIDSVEFLLYEAALGMADKPNDSGSYGTYTNAEVEEALNAVPGLSRTEKSDFWEEVLGKSEKNNPWG